MGKGERKMRKIITADVFAFARVIKASGMREQLTAFIRKLAAQDKELDVEAVGYEGLLVMIEALAERKAENALYEALGSIAEMKPADIQTLPPAEFFKLFKDISEENDIKAFFGYVSGILGKS
jgi:hypothetical protein